MKSLPVCMFDGLFPAFYKNVKQIIDKRSPKNFRAGFTIIEIAVVLAVLSIIFSLGLIISFDFYRQEALGAERDNMVIILKRARSEAGNNLGNSGHGFFISADKYTIFQGDSYASRNPVFDEDFPRTSGLTISGPSEIDFSPLQATSSVSSTLAVSNGTRTLRIAINYEGRIDW